MNRVHLALPQNLQSYQRGQSYHLISLFYAFLLLGKHQLQPQLMVYHQLLLLVNMG